MVARAISPVPVDAYLREESSAREKHEYVEGLVYAMAGASSRHNLVATNVLVALGGALRGKPCRAYNSDTKVRLREGERVRFYYPDVTVVCRPNPPTDVFHDEPVVVVEVLSDSTRRVDQGEKKDAYLRVASLRTYLLVDPDRVEVVRWRRTEAGFVAESYADLDGVIPLPEVDATVTVRELYEGASFD